MKLLSRPRLLAVTAAIVLLAAGVGAIVIMRVYPIATVNGHALSDRRFVSDYEAASVYYRNAMKTYAPTSTTQVSDAEIEAQVLQGLVDAELVHEGVQKEAGGDANMLVKEKIDQYRSDADLEAAAPLYGLDFDSFVNEVLVPQAERDILAGRLFLRGEKIDDWLADAERSAHVTIFSGAFRWADGKVEINK